MKRRGAHFWVGFGAGMASAITGQLAFGMSAYFLAIATIVAGVVAAFGMFADHYLVYKSDTDD